MGPTHRVLTGDEGRYLANTTLAYGGQGLSQFVYWIRVPDFIGGGVAEYADGPFNAERAVADAAAPLTPLGEALRQINPEFVTVPEQLRPLSSLGVYCSGQAPTGGAVEALPADSLFGLDPIDRGRDESLLWGFFSSSTGDATHAMSSDDRSPLSNGPSGCVRTARAQWKDATLGAGGPL